MKRIVLELTNRCNLRCAHCFEGRHGGRDWLAAEVFERIVRHASAVGYGEVSLTGGEPTLHPDFAAMVEQLAGAGYSVGMVTNGWNFPRVWQVVKAHQPQFRGVTFSLDGACEATHDGIRGAGSFRRVLQAMSICVARDIPFTLNMVLTRRNHAEIRELVALAAGLGAAGVRFGHLVPTPRSVDNGLYLSRAERDAADAVVREAAGEAAIPVGLAPGSRSTALYPCEPLRGNEINIDWRGNVSRCCHLSGQTHVADGDEVIGNVMDRPFPELVGRLEGAVEAFRQAKAEHFRSGRVTDGDYYPCDYCLKAFHKVARFGDERVWFPDPSAPRVEPVVS